MDSMIRTFRHRRVMTLLLLAVLPGCGTFDFVALRASDTIRRTPGDIGYEFETHVIPDENGLNISLWRVPARGEKKGTIVFLAGNDANKGRFTIVLPVFVDTGWDVILYDYQGFGESEGELTFAGLITSSRAVLKWATERDSVVVAFGASLGTPVAIRLASEFELTAMILESTLDLWKVPSQFLVKSGLMPEALAPLLDAIMSEATPEDYDGARWMPLVEEPKLFIHSPDDSITPFEGAWSLFQAAQNPKYFFVTQGDHAIEPFIRPDSYRLMVNAWLDGVLGLNPIDNPAYRATLLEDLVNLVNLGLLPPELLDELMQQPGQGG